METFYNTLARYATFIPILVALVFWTRWDVFFKIFIGSLVLSILAEAIAAVVLQSTASNLEVYYTYIGLHVIMLSFLWVHLPKVSKPIPTIICIGLSLFLVNICLYFLPSKGENLMVVAIMDAIYMMVIGLWYYYGLIKENVTLKNPGKDPYFIVASGFILYCLTTVMVYASTGALDEADKDILWDAKAVVGTIINVGYAYAIYCFATSNQRNEK